MKTGTITEFLALINVLIPLWEVIRDSKKTSDEAQSYGARMLPLMKQVRAAVDESISSGKPMSLDSGSRVAICESIEQAISFSAGVDDPDVFRARNEVTKRLLLISQARQARQIEKVPPPGVPAPAPAAPKKSKLPWILGGLVMLGVGGGLFYFLSRQRERKAA